MKATISAQCHNSSQISLLKRLTPPLPASLLKGDRYTTDKASTSGLRQSPLKNERTLIHPSHFSERVLCGDRTLTALANSGAIGQCAMAAYFNTGQNQ